jgi:ABC-type uncharacterized transport system permease subunit
MLTFRLKKRPYPIASPIASLGVVFASVAAALVVCAFVVTLAGANPLQAYWAILVGAFGSISGLVNVLMKATPLLLTGLGTSVAFRSGQWNIGGDGQIYIGALGATLIGLASDGLPQWLLLPLALLGGFVAGGLWAMIPALLKAYREVNEIISTLMLTYTAIFIIQYLVDGPLQGSSAFMPQTDMVAEAARLPLLVPPYRLHGGTVMAILMAAAVYILLWRSSFGYELRAAGYSPDAARYGGIKVVRNIVMAMVISGGLSGLAGVNEVLGFHYRLFDGISPGYGFTGIIVALLGRLNPMGLAVSSILFSGLIVGANNMQSVVGVPTAIAGIIQGVVVLFVLGTELLLEYRLAVSFSSPKMARRTGKVEDA